MQLVQEGLIHLFEIPSGHQKIPLLAAVGPLQFDLVQYRLESEYGAVSRVEQTSWTMVRWIKSTLPIDESKLHVPMGAQLALDREERQVLLFPSDWHLQFFSEHNKDVELSVSGDF